jgi:hypothetical protein
MRSARHPEDGGATTNDFGICTGAQQCCLGIRELGIVA